jgi:hypothetical protein
MRGIDGGVLANSVAAEALTSVLIGINRRYKVNGAGIRITGIPPDDKRPMTDLSAASPLGWPIYRPMVCSLQL